MATSGAARLVVLDVDGDEGRRSLHALEADHEQLPPTLTSATGGGGEQRLFVLPDELDLELIGNSVSKLGARLDVRASGGQIVVAPSLHRSGRRYRWAVRVAMAHLPSWMYALLANAPHVSKNPLPRIRPDAERLRRYGEAALELGILTVATGQKGARNATLFREAVSLAELVGAEVLSEERVWSELTRAARSAGLRTFEIRVTLARAFRRGLPEPRLPR